MLCFFGVYSCSLSHISRQVVSRIVFCGKPVIKTSELCILLPPIPTLLSCICYVTYIACTFLFLLTLSSKADCGIMSNNVKL